MFLAVMIFSPLIMLHQLSSSSSSSSVHDDNHHNNHHHPRHLVSIQTLLEKSKLTRKDWIHRIRWMDKQQQESHQPLVTATLPNNRVIQPVHPQTKEIRYTNHQKRIIPSPKRKRQSNQFVSNKTDVVRNLHHNTTTITALDHYGNTTTPRKSLPQRGHIQCPKNENVDDLVYWNDPQSLADQTFSSPFLYHGTNHNRQLFLSFELPTGNHKNNDDDEDWNDHIRIVLENLFLFAAMTGRTLVLPPNHNKIRWEDMFPFWNHPELQQQRRRHVNIITMKEFIEHHGSRLVFAGMSSSQQQQQSLEHILETCDNNNNEPLSSQSNQTKNHISSCQRLYKQLRQHGYQPKVNAIRNCLIMDETMDQSSSSSSVHNNNNNAKETTTMESNDHLRTFCANRTAVAYTPSIMSNIEWIHWQTNTYYDDDNNNVMDGVDNHHHDPSKTAYHLFNHFYAFYFFTNRDVGNYYKRLIRDFVRYPDTMFCTAGTIVHALSSSSQASLPNSNHHENEFESSSFSTLHIHRGKFLRHLPPEQLLLSAEEWLENTKHIFHPGEVLYIATNEQNKTFFAPFVEYGYQVRYLEDFSEKMPFSKLDPTQKNMIDSIVASHGRAFVGTWRSTLSGYIIRMRGYLGYDEHSSWYGFLPQQRAMHTYQYPQLPYLSYREWPLGWQDIDENGTTAIRLPRLKYMHHYNNNNNNSNVSLHEMKQLPKTVERTVEKSTIKSPQIAIAKSIKPLKKVLSNKGKEIKPVQIAGKTTISKPIQLTAKGSGKIRSPVEQQKSIGVPVKSTNSKQLSKATTAKPIRQAVKPSKLNNTIVKKSAAKLKGQNSQPPLSLAKRISSKPTTSKGVTNFQAKVSTAKEINKHADATSISHPKTKMPQVPPAPKPKASAPVSVSTVKTSPPQTTIVHTKVPSSMKQQVKSEQSKAKTLGKVPSVPAQKNVNSSPPQSTVAKKVRGSDTKPPKPDPKTLSKSSLPKNATQPKGSTTNVTTRSRNKPPKYTLTDLSSSTNLSDATLVQNLPLTRGLAGRPMTQTPALIGAKRGHIECDINVDSLAYWNNPQGDRDRKFQSPFAVKDGGSKYLTFIPDSGGWNNIRMGMETIFVFAAATGRTLVLPPEEPLYLLTGDKKDQYRGFGDFFPLKMPELLKRVPIISTEELIKREGGPGGRLAIPEANKSKVLKAIQHCEYRAMSDISCFPLWQYLEHVGHIPQVGANFAPRKPSRYDCVIFDEDVYQGRKLNPTHNDTISNFCGDRNVTFWKKKDMDDPVLLHFQTKDGPYRILSHFYAFILFTNPLYDNYFKRFIRDFFHYNDRIYCAAGKIVKALQMEGYTKGFVRDENGNGGFSSLHIRRGDFQYKEVKLSAEDWYKNTQELWQPNEILYIATDERNKTFFDPLAAAATTTGNHAHHHNLRFLDDYWELANLSQLDPNFMGMIDTIVASRGRVFVGTWFSTFSGYINRMRGYHGLSMNTSWYSWLPRKTAVHTWNKTMDGKKYSFEWPTGWIGIDADTWPSQTIF